MGRVLRARKTCIKFKLRWERWHFVSIITCILVLPSYGIGMMPTVLSAICAGIAVAFLAVHTTAGTRLSFRAIRISAQ
jgi:hypothetical protein